MQKVLVTGATGFIGQHLINCLKLEGFTIRTVGRRPVFDIETVICDFINDGIPKNTLEGIDVVFHLAGYAHDIKNKSEADETYQKMNVNVTSDLLLLSVQHKVKRFIFVSSVKAGGLPIDGECASEENQRDPDGIYGKTKREAELKVLEAGRESGMHVSILRPSLVYGPSVKGNLQLMMLGVERGWFPPLPDTGNSRSMIHVDDIVRALLLLARNKEANGEIFIATDGKEYSSRDIYEIMRYVLGKRVLNWSVPQFLFKAISSISPYLKYKIDKLLGDECYSSEKLQSLGFEAQREFRDINETNF